MNEALERLAHTLHLAADAQEPLRLAFGLACARRVEHLLEDPRAIAALQVLRRHVTGDADGTQLRDAAADLQHIAASHPGSRSLDGAAHAAVSATHAVAHAAAGRALQAASYAAYASVYAYGGHAVNDPTAFEPEFAWQVAELQRLAAEPAGNTELTIATASEESVRSGELGLRLRAFNYRHVGEYPAAQSVWLNLHGAGGRMRGGLRGVVVLHWLRVELLFVDEDLRGQGWGARLLRAGEERGRELGAQQAGVETFAWQAPEFYRRQGYEEAACLPDYIGGQSLYVLRKKLA